MNEYFHKRLGRWTVTLPDGRRMYRYRWLMEQHIGRPLNADEHVHHVNGDPEDDRIENLQLLPAAEHYELHAAERRGIRQINGWAKDHDACVGCGTTDRKHFGHGLCFRCYGTQRNRRKGMRERGPAQTHHLVCEQCGKDFTATSRQGRRKYCSRSCASRGTAAARWATRKAAA